MVPGSRPLFPTLPGAPPVLRDLSAFMGLIQTAASRTRSRILESSTSPPRRWQADGARREDS
jgi:hypothetical protein